MSTDIEKHSKIVEEANQKLDQAKQEIAKVIVGQKAVIDRLFIALFCDGHVLLEGLPGLAKTLVVKTLANVINCQFGRIQFTPDLLPADLTGISMYHPKEGVFQVKKGPVFTNLLLADEINRAPAKVQAALLEVMQERQVTIAGETFFAKAPYMVLATQNPIEQEGTYPLPEAQTDRFMLKVRIDYPTIDEEKTIMRQMAKVEPDFTVNSVLTIDEVLSMRKIVDDIYLDEKIEDYILNLVFASRDPKRFHLDIEHLLLYGASPRASMALKMAAKAHAFLSSRAYVTPHDVKQIGPDVLRHRLRLSYEAEAENISPDDVINKIFETVLVP